MDRWVGRVAVVTGSNLELSAVIVKELTSHGLKVVGLTRNVKKFKSLTKESGDATGKICYLEADVSHELDVTAAFDWIKNNLGGADILINGECIFEHVNLTDFPTSYLQRIFDVNVIGLSLCTQEAIKSMRERNVDDGHIIHISSVIEPFEESSGIYPPYMASKTSVNVLTEGLRRELVSQNSNIRVSNLIHGPLETEIWREVIKSHPDVKDEQLLKAEDVAQSVLYILGTPPKVQICELRIH